MNAEDQWQDEGSLLNLVARLAAIRLQHRRIGQGAALPIAGTPESVIALRYSAADHDLVVIHNLSAKAARLDLDRGASCKGKATALLGEPLDSDGGRVRASLPGYGFLWSKWAR